MRISKPLLFPSLAQQSDRSQSLARLVISFLATVSLYGYSAGSAAPDAGPCRIMMWMALAYGVYALAVDIWIRVDPAPYVARRLMVICSDFGIVSAALYLFGPGASFLYPVYLWVSVGNGMRFGLRYLGVALAIGGGMFLSVTLPNAKWSGAHPLIIGMLTGMIVLPVFYASLIRQLHATNRKLMRAVQQVTFNATHDPVTGLANRLLFQSELDRSLEQAQRQRSALAVLFLDLDNFKQVNDGYGHDAGDELLKMVAARLQSRIRKSDVAARLGGDEFIFMLKDIGGEQTALEVAGAILSEIAQPYEIGGAQVQVKGSIGIALFPAHDTDREELVKKADQAMYAAKQSGRNRCVVYRPDIPHAAPASPPSVSPAL